MASIRKRKNSYQITVSNGRKPDGTQIIETATFHPDPGKTEKQNKRDLDAFVFEFEHKVHSGKYLNGEKLTFQAFTEIWKKDYAEHHLEASTFQLYNHLLDAHILPVIGNLKVAKIQPNHLNKLYRELSTQRKDGKEGGYSPKTVKHVHNLISAVYTAAMKWNVVLDNPCNRVEPPKQAAARDKIKYFTIEQTELFLTLITNGYNSNYSAHDRTNDAGKVYHVSDYSEKRTVPTQYRLFYLLAVFCGMRRGELIALEWSDLDFENRTVSITKSTSVVNGKPLTKAPKTKTSIRTISVPASVLDAAREWRKEYLSYRMSLGSAWEGSNHIFIQWNGRQMWPDSPYNAFKRIIRNYNKSVTKEADKLPEIPLHGLRHTSATLLISQNVDVRTVSGRLGHAQTSTTMDIYSHALQKMDQKAADALDTLLTKKA